MRVIDIEFENQNIYEEETILPYVLKNNIDNEKFFQTVFFEITISKDPSDDIMDYVYRIFYEDVYLHNHDGDHINPNVSWYDSEDEVFHLHATLSELMGYINMAAPPMIINLVKQQGYGSIQELLDGLKEFLIVQAEKVPYYISKFKECMGMNQFPTKTSYDYNRMITLRELNGTDKPLVDIEAASGFYISTIATEPVTEVHMQCMINFPDHDAVDNWLSEILFNDITGEDSVINVFKNDKLGYFVEFNIPDYSSKKYPTIDKLIKASYAKLFSE